MAKRSPPDLALTITRTARGDYRCEIWKMITVEQRGSIQTNDQEYYTIGLCFSEEYTSKKLPDFMWQLAKRIMPK